jgi:hypothetical protein
MAKNSNSAKLANIGEPVITDEMRKVAELTPDPHNARRHSETQISQIAQPGHKGALKASSFKERIGIATDDWDAEPHLVTQAENRAGLTNFRSGSSRRAYGENSGRCGDRRR